MAASFRSAADQNNNNVSSHTCAIPTGTASGDLLLMSVLAYTSTGVPLSTPAGWTRLNQHGGPGGAYSAYNFALYSRTADGTEGSTVTLTSAAGCYSLISILAYQNAGGVDVSTDQGTLQANNNPQIASVTTTVASDLIVSVIQSANASSGDTSSRSTSGWSFRRTTPFFATLNAKSHFVEKAQATAGATGTANLNISSGSVGGTQNWTWTVAIKPSAPPVAPVADFTGTPASGTASLSVTFTDTSTNTPTSWAWSFGDGGTSSSQSPSHSYTTSGVYTVSLVATNASGSDTKTRTGYITVSETIVYATGGGIDIY